MAWREPRIWVDGPHITAAQMNQVSENLRETAPAKAEAAGDIFYATGRNEIARLALGSQGQFLVPGASAPQWASVPTPITTEGDLVVGGTGGAPERIGTAGGNRIFVARGQELDWEANGFLGGSPITTRGDLVVGDNGGNPDRLGTAGGNRIFVARGQALAWEANGFLGGSPITTRGDLAVGDSGGDPVRFGIGPNRSILSSNGSAPFWRAGASSDFYTPNDTYDQSLAFSVHTFGRTILHTNIHTTAPMAQQSSPQTIGSISSANARPASNIDFPLPTNTNVSPYRQVIGSGVETSYMWSFSARGGDAGSKLTVESSGDIVISTGGGSFGSVLRFSVWITFPSIR